MATRNGNLNAIISKVTKVRKSLNSSSKYFTNVSKETHLDSRTLLTCKMI